MPRLQGLPRGHTIPRWTNHLIWAGAGLFVVALFLSAIPDPKIRLLHALQSLIYVAVVVLVRRNSPWGFGAGCLVSGFWNSMNLFVTTFVADGLQELVLLLQTGKLARPDLLIAVVAFTGHCLLFVACLAAFLRLPRQRRRWSQFVGGGLVAIGYFILIIITTGPQFIFLLSPVFHLRRHVALHANRD